MFFDRYFGIEGHLYIGSAIRSSELDYERSKWVNLVRLYYPELFILAVMKCKKKLWKLTTRNINDLILDLSNKIDFEIFKANALVHFVQHDLKLKEPLIDMNVDISELLGYNVSNPILEEYFNKYKSFRLKMLSLLSLYNINPDNLNFGNFVFINQFRRKYK